MAAHALILFFLIKNHQNEGNNEMSKVLNVIINQHNDQKKKWC